MDGDCCMRQEIINRMGAGLNEIRAENTALKLKIEKLMNPNSTIMPCKEGHAGVKHDYPYHLHCPYCGVLLSTAQ